MALYTISRFSVSVLNALYTTIINITNTVQILNKVDVMSNNIKDENYPYEFIGKILPREEKN